MTISSKQSRYLRGLAHKLKPVVMIGNAGVTDNIIQEIDNCLSHHELIKVRIAGMDREARSSSILDLCQRTGCDLVNTVGHIAILFRASKNNRIKLPN